MIKKFFGYLLNSFLKGLAILAPLAVSAWAIVAVYKALSGFNLSKWPWLDPLLILVGVTLLGILASLLILQPIFNFWEKLMQRTPLVKIIYTSIKDLMEAFVGDKKKFNKPVVVQLYADGALKKLGFITQEDLGYLGMPGQVAVYLPHSYNFSGNMFVVDKSKVTALDADPTDVMKFIVSGGVTEFGKLEAKDEDEAESS